MFNVPTILIDLLQDQGSFETILVVSSSADLKVNIARIQQTLEQKLTESKNNLKELELVIKEKDSLGKENMILLNRVVISEDHTKDLKGGMSQVNSDHISERGSSVFFFRSRILLRGLSK